MKNDFHAPLYKKNLETWSHINPKAAVFLPYLGPGPCSLCRTENGLLNLKVKKEDKDFFLHDQTNPQTEAETWFCALDLDKIQVLYVFGIGLGYYYEAASTWLKQDPHHAIVFLEDDPHVINAFLQTKTASTFLKDPQANLYYCSQNPELDTFWEKMYWDFILTQMRITALKHYQEHKSEVFDLLHHKIIYDASIKNALVEEYLYCGAAFFKNFYPNMLQLPDSLHGNKLFGSFRNIPAIICGAGPSLSKQLPLLKTIQDRALIFAGGSALNALSSSDILPHFGAGIDPNPTQYYRLSSNHAFEVPMLYRNRMLHEAFMQIHGPRLYISGAGGYDISDWFEEKLGIKGEYLDEGHNVVNFSVEIAKALGCNPLIFIGMDLAYTDMQAYAKGIVEDASVTKKELFESGDFDARALLRKDIYGEPIYTLWKWIAESNWVSNFAKDHPNTALINATEGGIGFPDIQNLPFHECIATHIYHSYDLQGKVHTEIQNATIPKVTFEKVKALMLELRSSLDKCMELLTTMIEEAHEIKNKIEREKKLPTVLQTGLSVLCETELAEEIAYQYILEVFNEVYSRVLNREHSLLKRNKRLSEWKKVQKKQDLIIKRLTFLKEVVKVNQIILDLTLKGESLSANYEKQLPAST